jgi:hypothetical protein
MISCKESTRLMSEGQDRTLTLRERLALRIHTMMCLGCTNYGKHMVFLRKVARRYRDGARGDE